MGSRLWGKTKPMLFLCGWTSESALPEPPPPRTSTTPVMLQEGERSLVSRFLLLLFRFFRWGVGWGGEKSSRG